MCVTALCKLRIHAADSGTCRDVYWEATSLHAQPTANNSWIISHRHGNCRIYREIAIGPLYSGSLIWGSLKSRRGTVYICRYILDILSKVSKQVVSANHQKLPSSITLLPFHAPPQNLVFSMLLSSLVFAADSMGLYLCAFIFSGGLRKTFFLAKVRFSHSRSSKVIDNRKHACH